jgi:hypothetical protein
MREYRPSSILFPVETSCWPAVATETNHITSCAVLVVASRKPRLKVFPIQVEAYALKVVSCLFKAHEVCWPEYGASLQTSDCFRRVDGPYPTDPRRQAAAGHSGGSHAASVVATDYLLRLAANINKHFHIVSERQAKLRTNSTWKLCLNAFEVQPAFPLPNAWPPTSSILSIGFCFHAMGSVPKAAFLGFVLALLFCLSAAWLDSSSVVRDNHAQHPLVSGPHIATPRNFSVGFSLQSSYGAAAIILAGPDGQLETHTTVFYGGAEYREVMSILSLESSRHPAYCLSQTLSSTHELILLTMYPLSDLPTKTTGNTGQTSPAKQHGQR